MTTPQAPQTESIGSRLSRPEVRESIARLESVLARASALLRLADRVRPEAARRLAVLIDRQVDAELDQIPIRDLQGRVGRGIKLRVLEDAGFATAGAVRKASVDQLALIKGAGSQTVGEAKRAAKDVRDGLKADARFRFTPDRPDPEQAALLAALTAMHVGNTAAGRIGEEVQRLRSRAAALIPAARPAMKWYARRSKKDIGFAAAAQIAQLLADNGPLFGEIEKFTRLGDFESYNPEHLWKLFGKDAATYNSLLSTLGSPAFVGDEEAEHGHIGEEMSREVAGFTLDKRLLTSTLRGYQEFGARYALYQRRTILGDEMGLGKTVQTLAACAHLASKGQHRVLVVCPASVLFNWLAETEKHTRLAAHKLHGDDREEAGRRWLQEGGIGVTTFGTLKGLRCLDGADGIALLAVDEAHLIKNPAAERSKALLPFFSRADRVLFLSGTPMENRVDEFRNLVAYLSPRTAARISVDTGVSGARSFRKKVATVYLRRNRDDVLHELPEKVEVEDWVDFTAADAAVYRKILSGGINLGTFERLRHAAYQAPDSAKLQRVLELATEACEEGQKVVVFSRYLDVLERIGERLGDLVADSITGSVPVHRRQSVIDEFNQREDPAVLLSQIDTGGTGINLPSASVVILTEPQWKPSTEEQAVSRLYRLGQIRNVQVHRVLAKATVDELILEVLARKRLLFNEFARPSAAKEADRRAVDTSERPAFLDDESIPVKRRIVMAEQYRNRQAEE